MYLSGFPVTIKPRDVVFSLWNLRQISHLPFLSWPFQVNFVNFRVLNNTNYFLLEALP